MFKKRSSSSAVAAEPCILQKVSNLLKVPIIIISRRIRNPVIPRISLKKSRKKILFRSRRRRRRYDYDHYNNYGYQFQYQYCYKSRPIKKKEKKMKNGHGHGSEYLHPIFFLGKCLGMMKTEHKNGSEFCNSLIMTYDDDQDRLVSPPPQPRPPLLDGLCGGEELDDSIDERAEKFIEKFYEEMRLQRQDSFLSF